MQNLNFNKIKKGSLIILGLLYVLVFFTQCKKADIIPAASTTGQGLFWAASDFGCGNITVTILGSSKLITSPYTTTIPSCGASGCATFDLSPGTYSYVASCSGLNWNGSITITAGTCSKIQLPSGGGGGGTTPPTVTTPSTTFLASQNVSAGSYGIVTTEQFTISTTTTFYFRLASQYNMQAAIITPAQLSNFTSMAAFTGYGIFSNQFGMQVVTLSAGTYYVGMRNTTSGPNKWSWELDYLYTFPASDRVSFYDIYVSDALTYATNAKFWRPFKIESGVRYFLDGCNISTEFYIIPASELSKFQAGQTFQYYTDYYLAGGGSPGFWEIRLPLGDYVLVGSGTGQSTSTFRMDRWRVN